METKFDIKTSNTNGVGWIVLDMDGMMGSIMDRLPFGSCTHGLVQFFAKWQTPIRGSVGIATNLLI
jgi:hypothetical protein